MKSDFSCWIYILTNKTNTVLYVGRTVDIKYRTSQHRIGIFQNSFTAHYNVTKLVYLEEFSTYEEAAIREHQLKSGSRQKKIDLISQCNPDWKDLSTEWDNDDRRLRRSSR